MRFHFLLTNHYPYGCYRIEDVVVPIAAGLTELGHTVTYGFDDDIPVWPVVNLVIENFNDPAVVDAIERRRKSAQRYCFGLIGHEDIADATVFAHEDFPDRRPNLERALSLVDFGWTMVPCDYAGLEGGKRMRFLEYGYTPALRRASALPRDLDVLFYSDLGPRRVPMFNELVKRGLSVAATFGMLPEYMKFDLIDRSRVIADARRDDSVRFLAATRIVMALHAGVIVVSEQYDAGPLANLYRYVVTATTGQFLDLCAGISRNPDALSLGAKTREAFAAETSMARNLGAAMTAPVFAELAA
jgi:hypothetical protein